MSRIIKSVKTLEKLIGETVHVVTYDGYTCDAKVEKASSGEKGVVLVTEDKRICKDTYWWPRDVGGKCAGHKVRNKDELTVELKSVTTRGHKQTSKASTTVLGLPKLKEAIGHYCKLIDGSKGFIAKSCYSSCVCVLHNSEKVDGWNLAKRKEEVEEISDSFRKQFKYGWHVDSSYTANQVKVVEILDKPKTRTTNKKEDKQIETVSKEDVASSIGHFCTFASGDKGYIFNSIGLDTPAVAFNEKQNGRGWPVDSCVPEHIKKEYKYAYLVGSQFSIDEVKIVSIDPEPAFKTAESKKTVLDMTLREVLEKLNEFIKC